MKILKRTQSVCNKCFKIIPAETFIKSGKVFIKKKCNKHGVFIGRHVWDDVEIYKGLSKIESVRNKAAQVTVALTYKCNLNCPVCYANANKIKINDLDVKDLDRLKNYKGIYLTGGEPTVRSDLIKIIKILKKKRKRITLFSNGLKLSSKKYTRVLRKAGLKHVVLQFDSLDDKQNKYIRGKSLTDIKKRAVENMSRNNFRIDLYSVMVKENLHTTKDLFKYAVKNNAIRGIGVNPLWEIGRYRKESFVPSSEIIEKVCSDLKIKKNDWIQSSNFLCSVDKLLNLLYKRERVFGKCNMKCLLLSYKGKYIPITKVFNIERINKKTNLIYHNKNYFKFTLFFIDFLFTQIIFNFLVNKYFRIFLFQLFKNTKHIFKNNFHLINPFFTISLAIFPIKTNLDFDFIKDCNFHAVSSSDFNFQPACIHRIKASDNN